MTDEPRRSDEKIIKNLEKALEAAALNSYPNPDRIGCPGDKTILKNLAAKKIRPTDPVIQHVAECSPCFRELKQFQKELNRRRWLQRLGAVAALAAFVLVAVFLWRSERSASTEERSSRGPVIEEAVTLDFRPFAVTRGLEEKPTPPIPTLPRGKLNLTIILPVASTDGPYEFRIVNRSDRLVASGKVDATLKDNQTIISMKLETSDLRAGQYSFWLREQANDIGSPYPIEVR